MMQEHHSIGNDKKFYESLVILLALLCGVILINISASGLTIEQWLYNQFILFSHLLIIAGCCFFIALVIVLKTSRLTEESYRETAERVSVLTSMLTLCGCVLVYFVKYILLPQTISPNFSSPTLSGLQLGILYCIIVSFFFVLLVQSISTHQLHSIDTNRIIFQRRIPLPTYLKFIESIFNIVLFFLCSDRYLVIQALEITRLPREIIRNEQRPLIFQDEFQSTSSRKYEYEDISAYLKKSKAGAQELYISKDGTVKVRRYVFGTSRRLRKAIESAEVSIIRMKGGLESLSFEINDEVVSEDDLLKALTNVEISGYGSDRSSLCIGSDPFIPSAFVSVIQIEGLPEHNAYGNMTQHDRFIRHCLNLQVDVVFVTHFRQATINKKKIEQIKHQKDAEKRRAKKYLSDEEKKELLEYAAGASSGFAKITSHVIISAKKEDSCYRLALDIENSLNTIYSGTHYSVHTTILRGRKLKRTYKRLSLKQSAGNQTMMSVFQLSPFTHLPEKPILGIESEYIPEFEIPIETTGIANSIEIGNVVRGNKLLQPLAIKTEDLRRSMTILGMIGTGKTSLTKNMLSEFVQKCPEVNWIVFDYKSEYTRIGRYNKNILVLTPGSDESPLRINLFDPCNIPPEEHADRVYSLIREVYSSMFQQDIELSVQMERVLKDVLEIYIQDSTIRHQGFTGFLKTLDGYAKTHQERFSNLDKTITALNNRLRIFLRGALKEIFDTGNTNISFEELIQQKVIVNLGHLQARRVPKEDIRFLMNFLVRVYGDYAIKRGLQPKLRNLIIVEECQFLVPELYRKQTSIDATPTEDLSILLRAYGVGFIFIGTRPIFAENSLANSYTIVSFQLTKDAETLQNYMTLNDKQLSYLKRMRQQECIIFSPRLRYPTRVRVKEIRESSASGNYGSGHILHSQTNSPLPFELGPTEVTDLDKETAKTVKRIFCEECPLEGGQEFCKTFRDTAWQKKTQVPLGQFLVQLEMGSSEPENLFDLGVFRELGIHFRIKYCLLRYLLSDYRVISELGWSIEQIKQITHALKKRILHADSTTLNIIEEKKVNSIASKTGLETTSMINPQLKLAQPLPRDLFKILHTNVSDALPFDHCKLCPAQCDYGGHLGRILLTDHFDVVEFVRFVEEADTRHALDTCVQTAGRYLETNAKSDVDGLRSDLFGYCLYCASIYAVTQREGMSPQETKKFVEQRAQQSLKLLRSIP